MLLVYIFETYGSSAIFYNTCLKIHNNLIVIFFVNEDGRCHMKKTFYRDIAKVVWHPYLPMWVECMIKCLQITKFIHSKLSQEFTKSRSWLVTRTMFIALLPSEEVVDLHPWQVKILVSNKWWYFVYEDVSSLSCYDTFNLKAFDFSQFVHHWPQ